LAKYIPLSRRLPSPDTFARVFAALDPIAFQKCLLAWVSALHEVTAGQLIAIDGKVAREAMARAAEKGPLCLVSAWASANHVVLGQVAAPAGSSELGALPALLELLDLHGAIVTLDALGCQKDITAKIVEKQGDYVIAVKDNQEKLAAAVQAALGEALEAETGVRQLERHEENHGRRQHRLYAVMDVPADFPALKQWPSIRSLGMAVRECVDEHGQTRMGIRYYISSLPAKVRLFAQAVRNHWSIENQMHWSMDVTFKEDRSRARLQNSQDNLGMLRRVALTLLKNALGLKGSINCRRRQAGWNETTLETILFAREARQD
jgi:predicted transposase YbfD/YdcC